MSKKPTKLTDTIKEKIRNLYVQGIDDEHGDRILYSLDELAKKFNIAQSTLYRNAKNESWKIERDRFQNEYQNKLDQERQKTLVKESRQFDQTAFNISKALMGQVGMTIRRAQEQDNFTPRMVKEIAEATYQIQRIGKLALGEPTENLNLNARVQETDAFRRTMELLDTVAEQRRRSADSHTLQ